MTLADTPNTWHDGPSISTLHTLAIFAGIPLVVILAVALLVFAPSWVHGPRYRPGQPWQASSEWFGSTAVAEQAVEDEAGPTGRNDGESADPGVGGASAGW